MKTDKHTRVCRKFSMRMTVLILLINIVNMAFIPSFIWSQQGSDQERIQKILDKSIDGKNVFGIAISICDGDNMSSLSSGDLEVSDRYFLASVSKLYTASIIFQLEENGQLHLEDPISKYLSSDVINGLHVYNEIDYSQRITVGHLLSNTSGLSDYFEEVNSSGMSIREYILTHGDTALCFEDIIQITKSMSPHFAPGELNKAYYSDGNFQLLGKIIENITGKPLSEVYTEFIIEKIPLRSTYLFTDINDELPKPFYFKKDQIHIPKMMASFKSDGGMVSTSEESLIFLKAFFNGELFSEKYITSGGEWNKIYPPFQYGKGMMRFKTLGVPELIGHAGSSGTFAYYVPAKDIYIAGTINQIDKPQIVYRLLAKILATMK